MTCETCGEDKAVRFVTIGGGDRERICRVCYLDCEMSEWQPWIKLEEAEEEEEPMTPTMTLDEITQALSSPDLPPLHKTIIELVVRAKGENNLWHILTALRSLDQTISTANGFRVNERLKDYTTARVRSVIGIESTMYVGITNPNPLSEAERKQRDDLLQLAPEHFSNHYRVAVNATRVVFGYDLQTERLVAEKEGESGNDNG